MNAKFLVAKYIPNLKRMEPRNIGVIVWADGVVRSRFVGEKTPLPKHLGVKDKDNFRDWIQSWKSQIAKPVLEFSREKNASRTSPEFPTYCANGRGEVSYW